MTAMLIQSDVDTALTDFATKLAAASTAVVAMYTVQFPATSYIDASTQAASISAAGAARDAISANLGSAQALAQMVGDQVKLILPLS